MTVRTRGRHAPTPAAVAVAILWTGAAVLPATGGDVAAALVLALTALPATAIAVFDHGRPSTVALVGALLASAWASASGIVPQHWPWDKLEHLLLALALCRWLGDHLGAVDAPRWLAVAAAVGLTVTSAAVWEIAEWLTDRVAGTRMSPSDADTVTDLIAGALGALAGGLVLRARPPRA